MYGFGQIIYDKDKKEPVIIHDVWDISECPKRHIHFVGKNGEVWTGPFRFQDAEAEATWLGRAAVMLGQGGIKPADTPKTHCPDCGRWLRCKPADWCEDTNHMNTHAALRAKRCTQ